MAAYIPVPRDLSKVKTKVALNLTKRQLICIGAAAAVGFPLFYLIHDPLGSSMALMLCLIVMMPIILLAMESSDGPPMEVRLWYFVQAVFIRPRIRPYETRNIYATLMQLDQAREEVDQIVQKAEARAAGRTRRAKASRYAHPEREGRDHPHC